ncbi:MAG TPA: peptidoglycan-binding protein, partial [Chloroflexaceae bacterium]|nr:peptidoglycan-binding protein [Chloroflexaceae bacterium]
MRAAPSRSAVEAESPPPGRGGSAHTRWVQTSLNKIMGLRLAVDGQLGPATRSAVRAFQGRKGLAADGIVGPATEAAIVAALGAGAGQAAARGAASGAVSAGACEVLKGFDFDRDQLKPAHRAQVEAAARKVAAAGGASVRVVGHTDPVGSAAYNLALGKRRAERVAAELRAALERIRAGLGRGTTIAVESRGESEAINGDAP